MFKLNSRDHIVQMNVLLDILMYFVLKIDKDVMVEQLQVTSVIIWSKDSQLKR